MAEEDIMQVELLWRKGGKIGGERNFSALERQSSA